MSDLEEQYQAAARQRREHDAARPSTAEYITTTPEWRCKCGNTPESEGFHPWDRDAWRYVERDSRYLRCDRCKRVIVAPHGFVIDPPTLMRDVYGATFEPPPEDGDPEGVGGGAGPTPDDARNPNPERPTLPSETAATDADAARAGYRGGRASARTNVAIFGHARIAAYYTAAAPWMPADFARGFAAELAQCQREELEAVYGVCADCERPLTDGKYCAHCDGENSDGSNGDES